MIFTVVVRPEKCYQIVESVLNRLGVNSSRWIVDVFG